MKTTAIERPLGGEVRKFDLPLGSQRKIEEKCGYGLGRVYARLCTVLYSYRVIAGENGSAIEEPDPRQWDFSVNDYREVIYQALIGGRMADAEATRLVISAVDGGAKKEAVVLAAEILSAWLMGLPPAKKAGPGETMATEQAA